MKELKSVHTACSSARALPALALTIPNTPHQHTHACQDNIAPQHHHIRRRAHHTRLTPATHDLSPDNAAAMSPNTATHTHMSVSPVYTPMTHLSLEEAAAAILRMRLRNSSMRL
jgi:hypothetical protein